MKKYRYSVHLEREPEGGFTVTVPAYEHAVALIQEAIKGYLEVLAEEGKAISEDSLTGSVDTIIQVDAPAVA